MLSTTKEAGIGGDGHNAGKDGDGDAAVANFADPADEVLGVVEHLGDNKGSTHIDLFLEMVEELVLILVVVTALGVASNTNVKVVAVGVADMLDEVAGVLEAAFGGSPLVLVSGRVTAESKDICAASLVGLEQGIVDLLDAHVGASQMHTRLEAIDGLSLEDHFAGELGNAAASTPGDVNELGAEVVHAIHAFVEVLDTLCRLGGKYSKEKDGFPVASASASISRICMMAVWKGD